MHLSAFDPCPVCFVKHCKLPLPALCIDRAEEKNIDLDTYLDNLRDAIAEVGAYRQKSAMCGEQAAAERSEGTLCTSTATQQVREALHDTLPTPP